MWFQCCDCWFGGGGGGGGGQTNRRSPPSPFLGKGATEKKPEEVQRLLACPSARSKFGEHFAFWMFLDFHFFANWVWVKIKPPGDRRF